MNLEGGEDDARWRMLAAVVAIMILSMTTWFSASAILTDLQRAFVLSPGGAAWLTNAVQIGFVLAALTLGISGLSDVIPAPRLVAVAAAMAALSNLAILAVPNAAGLFAARLLTGMALAGVYPPALRLIAGWFARERGLAMGAAVGALTLGSSTPYLVRALGASLNWRVVILVSSLAAAVASVTALLIRPGPIGGEPRRFDVAQVGAVLRDRALGLANLGYLGHMWELYALWGWFLAWSSAADTVHPLPLHPAALTFLLVATGAAGCIVGGIVADRIGRTRATAIAMAVSGLCCVLAGMAWGGPPLVLLVVALVWGFAVVADSAQFSAMATELSEPGLIGTALMLQVGVGFALTLVSVRLTPLVADIFGWRWSFLLLAPGPLIGCAAMLCLRRHPRAAALAGGRR